VRGRDEIDSNRQLAPLRAAEDAHIVDTTGLDIEQVLLRVLELVGNWRADE
jgi:cytidylate kinase